MAEQFYKKQVALLLDVLPEIAKYPEFALHGGTAINLFVRDMPRLSVDIDLTYLPIEDRQTTLQNITEALTSLKSRLEKTLPDPQITHKEAISKLLINSQGVQIKIEVNQVARGTIEKPSKLPLCMSAQTEFDVFCAIPTVHHGQLYGGKICAALDRQHPRDLFDIKHLLETEGITPEVKKGFLLCLLSSDRPLHEVLYPNLLDQTQIMQSNFTGMTAEPFSYQDFEETRARLIEEINQFLTGKDKMFLLGFKQLEPDWSVYDFQNFPAVRWKMQSLQKLQEMNPDKHQALLSELKTKLGTS